MNINTDVIYLHDSTTRLMKNLKSVISESSEPVFIVTPISRTIVDINQEVLKGFRSFHPIGKNIDAVLAIDEEKPASVPIYFNNQWLHIHQEPFAWNDETYIKITLRRNSAIPDNEFFATFRNIIAVLANRLRSPLTGTMGYLDMLEDAADEKSERSVSKIRMGLDQLAEVVDELEYLYTVNTEPVEELPHDLTASSLIIRDLLFTYPVDVRNRIKVLQPEQPKKLNCNPEDLKQILTCLVDNAVEHTSAKDSDIIIDLQKNDSVTVSNGGNPIPAPVRKKLYYPFVTSKASSMGIGLTLAQLLAKRNNGNIYLSENSFEKGIMFTFCLPDTPNISFD